MTKKITGLVAAPFTPMHPDGTINTHLIPEMVDMLVTNQVTGMFVCGSTGEGPSLTSAERKTVAEAFVNAANKRIKVLVHVGHNSIWESKELAAHAQAIGADYISTTPPTYFKIGSVSGLVDCLAEIASAAPLLPFYYYNIPALTGVNLDMMELLERAKNEIPTLAGIKYTTPNIHEYQACCNFEDNLYDVLYGTDEMFLSALSVGAKGFIGSTYNFIAPLYQQIAAAFKNGDIGKAQQLQQVSVDIVRVIVKYSGLRSQKAMMKMIGIDCGTVRLPLNPMCSAEYAALENDLRKAGFFEWANTCLIKRS